MPYKKKAETETPEPEPITIRIPEVLSSLGELTDRVLQLEETVAYLQKDTEVVEEERIIYDVMFAVTEALRAINLHSTHRLARELEEKYFGPEEG